MGGEVNRNMQRCRCSSTVAQPDHFTGSHGHTVLRRQGSLSEMLRGMLIAQPEDGTGDLRRRWVSVKGDIMGVSCTTNDC